AGHRLSPWLGHLMISRSETARALLTPGEILQLPKTDEVVLMSGAPPIKAKKARYYADRRLQARVVKAPASCGQRHGTAPVDDWSTLPPVEPDPDLAEVHRRKLDSANGGLRREPELPEHVEVVARPKAPSSEFVRFWLTANPPLPEAARAAAQAQANERYEGFVEALARRLEGRARLADFRL
ncbi:MAG: type IV secretory system conjugative DNA transfer family protein, partial [Hyphomicrobium sp.]